MRQKAAGGKGTNTVRALIYALILFAILIGVIGALIRFSPLPERWMLYYVLGSLCIACLFLGLIAGNLMKRRGILFGALYAIIFLLIILLISVFITGTNTENGIFQIRYLLCLLFGGIGGMVGVNLRN